MYYPSAGCVQRKRRRRTIRLSREAERLTLTIICIKRHQILFPFQSDDSDVWDDTALIKAYDKAVASFKVITLMTIYTKWGPVVCNNNNVCVCQSALKGEEDPHTSEKNQPSKKRKNGKKNQSRKRSNTLPEKEVGQ